MKNTLEFKWHLTIHIVRDSPERQRDSHTDLTKHKVIKKEFVASGQIRPSPRLNNFEGAEEGITLHINKEHQLIRSCQLLKNRVAELKNKGLHAFIYLILYGCDSDTKMSVCFDEYFYVNGERIKRKKPPCCRNSLGKPTQKLVDKFAVKIKQSLK